VQDRLLTDILDVLWRACSMNLLENVGNIVGLLVFRFRSRAAGMLLLLVSVTATLSKTLIYFLHEQCSSGASHPTAHNFPDNAVNYFALYILPNSLWILFPTLVVRNFYGQLRAAIEGAGSKQKSQ
jgi:hypothetical protein